MFLLIWFVFVFYIFNLSLGHILISHHSVALTKLFQMNLSINRSAIYALCNHQLKQGVPPPPPQTPQPQKNKIKMLSKVLCISEIKNISGVFDRSKISEICKKKKSGQEKVKFKHVLD